MVDPVTAEIVRNYMETVAEEIIATMIRSSVNPIFNEAHDCSAGVFYWNGDETSIIARADAVPVHIYASLRSIQASLQFFQGDLAKDDILIVSDPYWGGTHIPDYTVIKPVFYEGRPIFFPAVRGHTLDSGGPVAGGYNPHAREIWQEGFRFAPLKLYEKGELRREVWEMLEQNNRLPDMIQADIDAMIGGCRIGEDRIRALCDRYGWDVVQGCVEWIFDYSEQRFRDQISAWPDGSYTGTSILDTDFAGAHDLAVEATCVIEGDEITVDFSGSAPQSVGIVNSVPGNTVSYVYSVLSALCPDIPVNSGMFRPITVKMPEGTVVNPSFPSAVVGSTVVIGCDVGDAVMAACAGFAPDRVGTAVMDLVIQWTNGIDGRNNEFFIQYDYHASPCSSGATKGVDGWGGWAALFCALTLASLEMTEVQYPCIYRRAELTADSAAPGQWRGSPAYVMERQPYNANGALLADFFIQGLRNPLQGYLGGRSGVGNFAAVIDEDGSEVAVTEVAFHQPVEDGDTLVFPSGGGGGWGDPLDRDPEAVLRDVIDEYVSIEGAAHDYGVIIDTSSRKLDPERTIAERARLKEVRKTAPNWVAFGRRQTLDRVGVGDGPMSPVEP